MDANGPWNGDRLYARRHAHAEVIFTLAPGDQAGTLFEATGTVTYSATGTGLDCTLELLPTTLPVIGYLEFAPTLPSPVYLISGGASGLLDHRLSCRDKPPMVISMEAWPWLVVPFQAAPVDAATLEGTMTVGDATYTWSFARNPLSGAVGARVITGQGVMVLPR
jgi:hypothetical protein